MKIYFLMIIICGVLMFLFNIATFGQVRKYSRSIFKAIKAIDLDTAKELSKKEKIVGKMVARITATYVIVYLPVIILVSVDPNATITYPWLMLIVHLLLNSLVIIDPLIYMLCHEKYREAAKRMFKIDNK